MRRKRFIVTGLVMAGVLAVAAIARAAIITVQSDNLGAGDTQVMACDPDGVVSTWAGQWYYDPAQGTYVVAGVNIDGVDPACAGQTLSVTATGHDTHGNITVLGSGQAVVPATGGSVSITFDTAVPASQIDGVSVEESPS